MMEKPPYEYVGEAEETEGTTKLDIDSLLSNRKPRTWYKTVWWWIRYGILNIIQDTPRNIKHFIQRGKRGYADCDVWGLGYYLSDVIYGSVKSLRGQLHGHPCDTTMKQWEKILDSIIWTFDVANKLNDNNWWYLDAENRNDEEMERLRETKKRMEENNDKYELLKGEKYHVMTFAECEKYEKGWKLFQKYFFTLWD